MKNQLLVAFLFEVTLAPHQWEVTDRSAVAVHARCVAGPCLLTETAGLVAKIWIRSSSLLCYYDQYGILQAKMDLFFFKKILFLAFQEMQIFAVLSATGDCMGIAAVQGQGILCVCEGKVTLWHLFQQQSYILTSKPDLSS